MIITIGMPAMDRTQGQKQTKRLGRRGDPVPTLAEVAKAAGVSHMTVSRVVNQNKSVSPETREKVEQTIAALGYVPNPTARSLAGGRQCRIALLYSNPSAAYLSEFLAGSLRGAAACDAQLVVEHWADDEDVSAISRRFAAHRIDATLLPPPLCDDTKLIQILDDAHIPVAQIATGQPFGSAHAVTISDVDAARAITEHLIDLGHHRIAFIAGNPNQTASQLRQSGYQNALRQAGLPVDPALVEYGDFTYCSGLKAGETLLALSPRPTAIFASNDDMAAAVISVAHRQHLRVPEDLSVCGFDDTALATTIWPELTTIRQPIAEMAEAATLMLAQAVEKGRKGAVSSSQLRRLEFSLVRRGSTAAPFKD
jgi:LacI family transcriptional regulator